MKKTSVSLFAAVLFLMFSSTVFGGTIFGPKQYDRTSGAPNIFTESFSATPGESSIIVTNGDASGKHLVTSARIYINGEAVFNADDINRLEIPLQLLATNSVAIELNSKPGIYLRLKSPSEKHPSLSVVHRNPSLSVRVQRSTGLPCWRTAYPLITASAPFH